MSLTRSALLGAGSAVALVGLPLMTSFVEAAQGADAADLASLNAAITLERFAIEAYGKAAATGLLAPGVLAVVRGFVADHTAHRDALSAAVRAAGMTPTTATAAIAYPSLATAPDILHFALVVEKKAAATYLSVVPDLKDRSLAAVAASILGVETTHVAILSSALGERAYPTGFVG